MLDSRALVALAAARTGRADAWEAEVLPKMKEAAVAALRAAQNEARPAPRPPQTAQMMVSQSVITTNVSLLRLTFTRCGAASWTRDRGRVIAAWPRDRAAS